MPRAIGPLLLLLLLSTTTTSVAFILQQGQQLAPPPGGTYGCAGQGAPSSFITPTPQATPPPAAPHRSRRATPPPRSLRMAAQPSAATDGERHRVLIIGGGTGGVGVAAQLLGKGVTDVCIVEPAGTHYYQPGWTFVGGGIFEAGDTARPMAQVIPSGVRWVQDAAAQFRPAQSQVVLKGGATLSYDYLVVAMGLQLDWAAIPGLPEALARGDGVCSNYDPKHAAATWQAMQRLGEEGGNAIFTQPNTPVKCGGAPQKIMWLTEDYLRRAGKRDVAQIYFSLPAKKMFGVDRYVPVLDAEAEARGVHRLFETVLTRVDGARREATFKRLAENGTEFTMPYRMLHVTPPMSAPDVLKASPIVNDKGFVDVDMYTTQHVAYPNIFALGDASSLPTSKTMAAITGQAPVLVHNMLRIMAGKKPTASYDGFASCPIVLGYDKLIMTEFVYGCVPKETFTKLLPLPLPFLDQSKPSYFYFLVKKYVFPFVYWNLFIHGKWFGSSLVFPPDFSADDARVDGAAAAAAGAEGAGTPQQQRR